MASGDPWHADLHVGPTATADPVDPDTGLFNGPGTPLFAPQGGGSYRIRFVTISGNVTGRVLIGFTDRDGRRVRAVYFPADGGFDATVCQWAPTTVPLVFWHDTDGAFDVAAEGEYL